jgi:opacity protein-like surface antigen
MRRVVRFVMCALPVSLPVSLAVSLAVSAFAPRALADDLDVLRGALPVAPATFTRWSGFYVGGQFGYSDALADFSSSTQSPIAYALRESVLENEFSVSQWPTLGKASQGGLTFGGFAGYNTQWQDLILGVEGNYNHASINVTAPSSKVGPLTTTADSQGFTHAVAVSGNGSMAVFDYGSLRARAGYVLGNFLPYGFAGLAIGEATTNISANVQDLQCFASAPTECGLFSFDANSGTSKALTYGFVAGGGIDIALTPNVFVRGEFEYAQFAPISGIAAEIMTARVGAGLKF